MSNSKVIFAWLAQAISGASLVLLLGIHWISQHYITSTGLRTYADVIRYLRQPWVFALETAFLIVVTGHALLGVRAILFDFSPHPATCRIIDKLLWGIGLVSVGYGIYLTWQIIC